MKAHFSVYMGYYLSVALYILVLYCCFWLIEFATRKTRFKVSLFKEMKDFFFVIIGFSYIGMTLGLLTGLSLSPVVQAVIPALLVFMTGLSAYMFRGKESKPNETSKESELKNYKIAVSALIFISVFLMYGLEIGSGIRAASEYETKIIERDFKNEQLKFEKKLELQYLKELKKYGLDSIVKQ